MPNATPSATPPGLAPRVDLHRHLEGAIRPRTAWELGRGAGLIGPEVTLEQFIDHAVVRQPAPLLQVLDRFDRFRDPIRGEAGILRIVAEAVADAAAEGVTHLNLRFSPVTLARASGLELRALFETVRQGFERAASTTPRLALEPMVVISRRRGVAAAWDTVRQLDAHAAGWVVGADFAADELRHRTVEFRDVARELCGLGLPLTVHTGEGVDCSAVAEALELPGVRRLGHALSLVDDPGLVREAVARDLLVEVCLTSNVRVQTVSSVEEHPVGRMLAGGVKVALCSDDPALFGIDLEHELTVATQRLGWSSERLAATQAWAAAAWFGVRAPG